MLETEIDELLGELKEYLMDTVHVVDEDELDKEIVFKAHRLLNRVLEKKFITSGNQESPLYAEIQDLSRHGFIINNPIIRKLNSGYLDELSVSDLQNARFNVKENIKRYENIEDKIVSLLSLKLLKQEMKEEDEAENSNAPKI